MINRIYKSDVWGAVGMNIRKKLDMINITDVWMIYPV